MLKSLGMQGLLPSGPWTSLCSACVLELAAPRQCREEAAGPLCALGVFVETPGPAVLAGGKGPTWCGGGTADAAPLSTKKSREAERSPSEAPLEVGLPQLLPARVPELPPGLCGDFVAELHAQLLAGAGCPGGACGGNGSRMRVSSPGVAL